MYRKVKTLIKTIYFNFKIFPLTVAIKLPILISSSVKLSRLYKGTIDINGEVGRFMIKIGFGGSEGVMGNENGYFYISPKGRLVFNGNAHFSKGISIRVDSGIMRFGKNFNANSFCYFACNKEISFGNDVLIGSDVTIRDNDGHKLFMDNNPISYNSSEVIKIGHHVWIASKVDILKGGSIPDNCVVAYRSCVFKSFEDAHCIIGGYPAKVIKKNIRWEA